MHLDLTTLETRVLGCLLEKEQTTPEAYPLTLNSLTAAVNQTTNRDPVMSVDTSEVETALEGLRGKKIATLLMMAGARAPKFRHQLPDHYDLTPAETAVLCVLLLRGPQTIGELKGRSERLHPFPEVAELEQALAALESGDEPLVRQLPPRPGQKGSRWAQIISGEPDLETGSAAPPSSRGPTAVEQLQNRVESLESDMASLREELEKFKRQFDS